jgi:hypothetical protein
MFIQLTYNLPHGMKTTETLQHLFSKQSGTILDMAQEVYSDSEYNNATTMIDYTKFFYIDNSYFLNIDSEHMSESFDYIIDIDCVTGFSTLDNPELNETYLDMEELEYRFNGSQPAIRKYIKDLLHNYI